MAVDTVTAAPAPADWADRACDTAFKHYHSGLPDEARQICIRILEVEPRHGRSLYLLALIAVNSGDAGLALAFIDESVQHLPGVPFCHLLRGQILFRLRRLEEAAASIEQALRLRPQEADGYTCLAHIRAAQDRPEEALELYGRSLRLRPDHMETMTEMATAYRRLGRQGEALELYRKALLLFPENGILRNNCGLAYGEAGDAAAGIAMLEQAVALAPAVTPYRFNLAQLYNLSGRYADARDALLEIQRRDPNMPDAPISLGAVLAQLGLGHEAAAWNREYLPLARRWPEAHAILLMAMHYDPDYTAAQVYEEHRLWRTLHAPPCPPRPAPRRRTGRIRLGYVSADFYRHPVGWFLRPVIQAHNREQFDVYCYSTGIKTDDLTEEFRRHATWRQASGWGPDRLAEEVRRDEIDILVDLNGFTANNRMLAFTRRPAPVQVTWLGYPHSTGLEAVDYRITDEWADPVGRTEHLHTEKLVRLPGGFLCYGPDPDAPAPAVPEGPITFGCFNGLPKINDQVIALWARILNAVPGSILYLKTRPLDAAETRENMRQRFAQAGVDPSRLRMDAFDDSHGHHLGAYNQVDIALDTFPYNGTTTSYDALWMGVPLIALEGDRHVSRVCASILHRAGRAEWLAATPDVYVQRAVAMASAPRPAARRRLLPPAMTDGPAFARTLETAYHRMVAEAEGDASANPSLQKQVAEKPFWYHKIELPGGIVTPGWAPLSRDAYRVPEDLTGLRVLDVGAWDGYWSFLALQRGA
ncbi:MAG: tetratricopeptide repeat protein, partial [Proteobacteria bacterium]|nr:tetratricopeptide repeat protein [Pseudomonadota bacterium]